MNTRPPLIVTAHDFGYTKSINDGILYCLKQRDNIITEIAYQVNAPGSLDALEKIKSLSVSLSLSIDLTSQKPLSRDVPSLVGDNGFFKKVNLDNWDFSVIDEFEEDEIAREMQAQWDWFVDHVGRLPSALLFKKNEHGDPKILLSAVSMCKKYKVPLRAPVWRWQKNYGAQSYVEQHNILSTSDVRILMNTPHNPKYYNFAQELDRLITDVKESGGVNELMVLPGFVDSELMRISKVNWERGIYVAMTKNSEVMKKFHEHFELISYKDLNSFVHLP